jgi:hypothetical protein
MRPTEFIIHNEKTDLDILINNKRKPNLTPLKKLAPKIWERYQAYDKKMLHGYLGRYIYTNVEKSALERLYFKDIAFNSIRDKITSLSLSSCPYCSMWSPSEIDHFLPQSIYPEFSAKPSNLIYSCEDCNNLKRARIYDKNRNLLIPNINIHPVPKERIFYAKLAEGRNGWFARYHYHIPQSVSDPHREKLIMQIQFFELITRFQEEASKEISRIERRIRKPDFRKNRTRIINHFRYEGETEEEEKGICNWKAVLYRAAWKSNEFLDHCSNLE